MKLIKKDKNEFDADWINANINVYNLGKSTSTIEKEINQYITLKLVSGRTYIYVNGKRFIQCIRLILNIPKEDISLFNEIDSIDEAAKLYDKHIFQNRIVRGPMATLIPNQSHTITPEQEFWGHCSNIQAWVEHDYDTRILMSNISFPLLRELSKAGDPLAKKVFKEEIALRLESGYPSVVQYLLAQKYIQEFSPEEVKTIIETTDIIRNISSDPKTLSQFLKSCVSKFPILLEDILLQILKVPDGKKTFFSIIKTDPIISSFRPLFRYTNPKFLFTLRDGLENLFNRYSKKTGEDILDCIQAINDKLMEQFLSIPGVSGRSYIDAMKNMLMNNIPIDELNEKQKLIIQEKILEQVRRRQSRCSYCGKEILGGKDICEWCGHKRKDDEGGFFPYPFIFKPPGGGGSTKGTIAVPIKVKY